ncbi:MFS transporter [Nakamurella alba]|uniref:MFS transporter n=1 Tax=Nakamurella alba TaxID=2665158 RepID=UPI002AC356A9|nr:MFS transporter [Nakamurella alba]
MVLTIFLVALCLRPALTSVGPLLPTIGADLGVGEGTLGGLGTLPLLAFAAVSPLVTRLTSRIGTDRALLLALTVLTVALLARSYTGVPGLWVGTAVIGAAIAVGNVLVPVIVKRDFGGNVSLATGVYSAFMTVSAAVASAVSVPIALAVDWRFALAVWAALTLVVTLAWLPRALRSRSAPMARPADEHKAPIRLWRRPTAWLVTGVMGLQSTTFYVMVNWLPSIEAARGVSEEAAGVHLFVYIGVGVIGGLVIPLLFRSSGNQVLAGVVASMPMIVGVIGILLAPGLSLLWVVIAGLGSGASLVVALSLISIRGRDQHDATRLSGMAQSLGYLLAAAGPIVAGSLAEATGSWTATLVAVLVAAVLQLGVAIGAGRPERSGVQPSGGL